MAQRHGTTIAAVLAGLGRRAITTAAAHEDAVTSWAGGWERAHHGRVRLVGRYRPGHDHRFRAAGFRPRRLGPVAGRAHGDGCSPAGMSGLRGVAGSSSPPTWTMPGPHVPAAPERGARGDQEAAGPGGGQQPGRVADARGHLGPAVAAAPARRAGDEARAEKDLMRRARLLAEAGVGLACRPGDFGSALAESHDQAERSPAWPVTLIRDLGRAGQGTEAVTLSETLAVVDPARHGLFAGEAAIALAEAGLADDARAKIAEAALAYFQVALPLAQQAKDYKAIRNLSARIFRLTSPAGEMVQRRQPRSRPSRSQRKGRR